MTDAPEKMPAYRLITAESPGSTRYIRTDIAQAMVAAERERCAALAAVAGHPEIAAVILGEAGTK